MVACKELLDTDLFKAHANHPACKLLLKLCQEIEEYYSNPATIFNVLSKEKLLGDSKWIEIQRLAGKVKHDLNLFVKEGGSHV